MAVTLGAPAAVPRGATARAALAVTVVRAAVALPPWGGAVVGALVVAAALLDLRRPSSVVAPPRLAAVVLGGAMTALAVWSVPAAVSAAVAAVAVTLCSAGVLAVRPRVVDGRDDVARLVVDLGRAGDAGSQEALLARAMGEPGVRMLYRVGPDLPLVDASGAPAAAAPGRVRTVLATTDDDTVQAALEHSGTAVLSPAVRVALEGAAALAVRRLRLAALAARQVDELAQSRRRLVDADLRERQHMSADVAEGPQRWLERSFDVLDGTLGMLSEDRPADVVDAVRHAHAEVLAARADLAGAVSGDLELVLATRGLGAALEDLGGRVGAHVEIEQSGTWRDDRAAQAAWFVASEALTNAVRYARAGRVAVRCTIGDDSLEIVVTDDGIGGADPSGGGLTGLRRRVDAAGGTLQITPGSPSGTRVRARFTSSGDALPLGEQPDVAIQDVPRERVPEDVDRQGRGS